jgi:hypothetical protein
MSDFKVVARFRDGRVVKGATQNFWPERDRFHLVPVSGEAVEVAVREMKALFIVRSFEGDAGRVERKLPAEGEAMRGTPVKVKFADGEMLCGTTLNRDPTTPGFFLFPFDPNSNNIRIFVVNQAVDAVEPLKSTERSG